MVYFLHFLVLHLGLIALVLSLKCKSNINGGNYDGSIRRTRSGLTCQRWDRQTPHSHNVTAASLPDTSLTAADNFCRSPDFDPAGPWCFTINSNIEWEYCHIPTCESLGCKDSVHGEHYIGRQDRTVTGAVCEQWPLVQLSSGEFGYLHYPKVWFPDGHRDHNYCRNPFNLKSRPWCHIQGSQDQAWDYCDIPLCEHLRSTVPNKGILPDKSCSQNGGRCVASRCCTGDDYVASLCQDPDLVCCTSPVNCDWAKENAVVNQWPHGSYGLLKPIFDCPDVMNTAWLLGVISIKRTTGAVMGRNQSELTHASIIISDKVVNINLCLRNQDFMRESPTQWPQGQYCFFRYKDPCPSGFQEHTLAIAETAANFSVNFGFDPTCDWNPHRLCLTMCCGVNAASNDIQLPSLHPFYLLMFNGQCQKVKDMMETHEYLTLGVELGSSNDLPPPVIILDDTAMIGLCFYQPKDPKPCYDPVDEGFLYRGKVNVTTRGECSHWTDMEQIDHWKLYHHVGLDDNNYCRNSVPIEFLDQPWCFVHGLKVKCDVPQCQNSPWDNLTEIGKGRPARQTVGGPTDAQLANDGLISTCSNQIIVKAWWQMDLQAWYHVHGVRIYRAKVELCVVRLFNVHVGLTPDDFREGGALMCARNMSLGASPDGVVPCTQPVLGQYITIFNLAYLEYEIATAPYERCFSICEVNAYVKDSKCGRRLLERDRGNEILPLFLGSDGRRTAAKSFLLNNAESWCGSQAQDGTVWFRVDLLYPRKLQGFSLQGSQDDGGIVTRLSLKYGLTNVTLRSYQEYEGYNLVFDFEPEMETPQLKIFQTQISARILVFDIIDYMKKPCVRFDVIGCLSRNVNLLRETMVAEQSSQLGGNIPQRAIDNDVLTCSETMVENATWWTSSLPDEVNIHSLVIQTGVTFLWNQAGRRHGFQLSTGWGAVPSRVIDGSKNGNFYAGGCATTPLEPQPWWAVDMGADTLVRDVLVTNRADCCEQRLNKFQIFVGDVSPMIGQPLNTSLYEVCVTHDAYYGIGETRRHVCDEPLVGRYLVVMLNSEAQFLTLCEVQVFGKRDPFHMGLSSSPPPEGVIQREDQCSSLNEVPLGGLIHTYTCAHQTAGTFVTAQADGRGTLSICDMVAHGGTQAGITTSVRNDMVRLQCEGSDLLHIEPSTGDDSSITVYIKSVDFKFTLHYCEGEPQCLIPAVLGNRGSTFYDLPILVFCTHTFEPRTVCQEDVTQEGEIITPNFPFYYGADMECKWRITVPSGLYISLMVSSISLPDKPQPFRDGCSEVNLGDCADTAIIYYGESPASLVVDDINEGYSDIVTLSVTQPSLYITDTDIMTVTFKSCYRNVHLKGEWQAKLGFRAAITFEDCVGCKVQTSGSVHQCSGECGQIISQGYPNGYGAGTRTLWTITVHQGTFISLSFKDFDVYEAPLISECIRDYVEVQDVNLIGTPTTVGRFCNSKRPPTLIKSSWSQLLVVFITDVDINAKGFHAMYRQNIYQLSDDFPAYGPSPACPMNATRFVDSCYILVTWYEPLIWLKAEEQCLRMGGHLVAINNRQEMVFLHYMLTTQWQTDFYRTFIGLNDRHEEGLWAWVDGSPVTFTDWSRSSDSDNVYQPDGAAVEDCTMIRLDSIHDTRSWHDIPCAYDQVQQFLCETSASDSTLPEGSSLVLPAGSSSPLLGTLACSNGEYILEHLWCDGRVDCHDGSDEIMCYKEGSDCLDTQFQCDDSSCISMSLYCDFNTDCPDHSDELRCVHPVCVEDEFTCTSGECVPTSERCDLQDNCQDGSDEQDCTTCGVKAYQCFDGACIPGDKRCDTVVDCPGSLHEDESEECAQDNVEKSCLDWKTAGMVETGKYAIKPDGVEGFQVECDFMSGDKYVATVIHHDSESSMYVTGYAETGDYLREIDYKVTTRQLESLILSSLRCEQHVQIRCWAADNLVNDYWINRHGIKKSWLDDTDQDCACLLKSACNLTKECECSISERSTPRYLTNDEGYIHDSADLPMMALTLSGTLFSTSQYQYHKIGPLVCYQYANKTREDFHCASGQWIPQSQRCLSSVDQYGDDSGCRDKSHLQGCEEFSCPPQYMKCGEGHCIGVERICDGSKDCLIGGDEDHCDNFTCAGHLRCLGESKCVSSTQRCDGVRQCKAGNDEWHCHLVCPPGCSCTGLVYDCRHQAMASIPPALSKLARKINFNFNDLTLENSTFEGFTFLGVLGLESNGLSELPVRVFHYLINLYLLDLSNNQISMLRSYTFEGLGNLRVLNLVGNSNIKEISSFAFFGLSSIKNLNLKDLGIVKAEMNSFSGVPELQSLDLSMNRLPTLQDVLVDLPHLNHLNISRNLDFDISRQELAYVEGLQSLQSDLFKFCCFVNDRVPEASCLPERDEFSSCEDLMRRDVLKVFLWVLGLMAFLCNLFVLVYRKTEKMTVYSFSVMHLAVADFLMGVYMVVLASVDAFYRGVYIEYAEAWTGSWTCQFLGFLNTFSSETSVFILCVISADRFYKIVFPLQGAKFGLKQVRTVMAFVWGLGLVIAALPLFPIPYFGERYYGKSSVCISIYLTRDNSPGWEYSVAISHVLNFSCFMFIFLSYSYLFHAVKQSGSKAKSYSHGNRPNQNDIALARRLTLVVFTDFICWVPINLMGAMAGAGVPVPGEVYAWVVVFLLPINSAINPLLYTISSIRLKAKAANKMDNTSVGSGATVLTVYETHHDQKDLKTYLSSYNSVPLKMAVTICHKVATVLADVHSKGCSCTDLDPSNIMISHTHQGVMIVGLPVCADSVSNQNEDIHAMGKLVSYLLRRTVAAPTNKQ